MFFIPGILIAIITFPGVIVHEIAHQLFCRITRVPVLEVCYFRVQNPCGYVIHESTDHPWKNFIISTGPFFLNSIIGMIVLFPAAIEVIEFKNYSNPFSLFLAWLGISILMHSFPSRGDASNLYKSVINNKSVALPVKMIILPFIGLICIGAYGSIVWLDLLYAVGAGMLIPNLIVSLI